MYCIYSLVYWFISIQDLEKLVSIYLGKVNINTLPHFHTCTETYSKHYQRCTIFCWGSFNHYIWKGAQKFDDTFNITINFYFFKIKL